MGAHSFEDFQEMRPGEMTEYGIPYSVDSAFTKAQKRARMYYGHRAGTGSIAEKDIFVCVSKTGLSFKKAYQVIKDAHAEKDKYGPAGAIRIKQRASKALGITRHEGWLFFGMARS